MEVNLIENKLNTLGMGEISLPRKLHGQKIIHLVREIIVTQTFKDNKQNRILFYINFLIIIFLTWCYFHEIL